MFGTALEPIEPPIQLESGGSLLGVKRPGREVNHAPPSTADVNNDRSFTSSPPARFHGVHKGKPHVYCGSFYIGTPV